MRYFKTLWNKKTITLPGVTEDNHESLRNNLLQNIPSMYYHIGIDFSSKKWKQLTELQKLPSKSQNDDPRPHHAASAPDFKNKTIKSVKKRTKKKIPLRCYVPSHVLVLTGPFHDIQDFVSAG
jgi:hypothetical protein